MTLFSNASFFLSATNPVSSSPAGPDTPAEQPSTSILGAGEETSKRILQALSKEPATPDVLAGQLDAPPAEVESAIAYLREAGMVDDKSGGVLELSPFAHDALKILAL